MINSDFQKLMNEQNEIRLIQIWKMYLAENHDEGFGPNMNDFVTYLKVVVSENLDISK